MPMNTIITRLHRHPKPRYLSFFCFFKSFSSWGLAIRDASSTQNALFLYSQMHRQSATFDSFSILYTLKSCTQLHNLVTIQHLHAHIVKLGFSYHVYVVTALLNAYNLTSFADACLLFDEMPDRNCVTWNTMITGYSRYGDVEKASSIFNEMPLRNVASWSAMIAAYLKNRNYKSGLSLFRDMVINEGLKADQITAGSVLSGCAQMGGSDALLMGKSVHGFITKNVWELNVELGTVLLDMYAKCGILKSACNIFQLMQERNVMSWTALICGLAQHGHCTEALSLFEMMQKENVRPNELTFTGILSACVHTGLFEEGRKYFKMIEAYGLQPRIQHYGCMVDLLGRAGLVAEAYDVIKTMKLEPNVVVWTSFLSACKEHNKFEMAKRAVDQVLKIIKPGNDGGVYSVICDLYASEGKWDEVEALRQLMLSQNVRKVRGSSIIRSGLLSPTSAKKDKL